MDISTGNALITSIFAAGTGAVLFVLGLIASYVRTIKQDMTRLLTMGVEHEVKLGTHKEQIADLYDKMYKLNTATK